MTQQADRVVTRDTQHLRQIAKNLENRIGALQDAVDKEVTRLERLRNEEGHIEGRFKALEESEKALENKKHEFSLWAQEQKELLQIRSLELDKIELAANAKVREAHTTLKEVEQKLRIAETKERDNYVDFKQIETKRTELAKQEQAIDGRLSDLSKEVQKLNELMASCTAADDALKVKQQEFAKSQKQLETMEHRLSEQAAKNRELLVNAQVLDRQAKDTLAEAQKKAEESQLSVDRQWNQIEIEKKALKNEELRLQKIIKDHGIEEQFKKNQQSK